MMDSTQVTASDPQENISNPSRSQSLFALLPYLFVGIAFGFVAIRSEIVSWYRIQEMFRFQSFHMYGIIGSAVIVGGLSVWLIKRFKLKSLDGEEIIIPAKAMSYPRYLIGGSLFGLGWALVGVCPGPIFVLIGAGYPAVLIVLIGAVLGTYLYGSIRAKLPH